MTEIRTNWGRKRRYADPPDGLRRLRARFAEAPPERAGDADGDAQTRVITSGSAAPAGRDGAASHVR